MKRQEQRDELPRLIDFREVRRLCGLSRSAVWRLEREGNFPRRRLVTATKVAWVLHEVLEWINGRTPVGADSMPQHNLPEAKAESNPQPQAKQRRSWLERDDE
jgi:prophage regulatory protein